MKKNNPLKKIIIFGHRNIPAKLEVILYDCEIRKLKRFEWGANYITHPLWIILKENLIHDHNNKPTKH